jgi:hypothetical protein
MAIFLSLVLPQPEAVTLPDSDPARAWPPLMSFPRPRKEENVSNVSDRAAARFNQQIESADR